jgi:NhaP-type Na+/H+ and K+/H+ antiporter
MLDAMSEPDLLRSAMRSSHELILLGGLLGVLSVIAGLVSRRIAGPMLLAFLALGMLAGEEGVRAWHPVQRFHDCL